MLMTCWCRTRATIFAFFSSLLHVHSHFECALLATFEWRSSSTGIERCFQYKNMPSVVVGCSSSFSTSFSVNHNRIWINYANISFLHWLWVGKPRTIINEWEIFRNSLKYFLMSCGVCELLAVLRCAVLMTDNRKHHHHNIYFIQQHKKYKKCRQILRLLRRSSREVHEKR